MNQQPSYLDSQHNHIAAAQSYTSQPQITAGMSAYPHYQQQAAALPSNHSYANPQPNYGQYYGTQVTSSQGAGQSVAASMGTQLLPSMTMGAGSHSQHPYSGGSGHAQNFASQTFDSTGQIAPPGMKPRVTATLWEDEGCLCFQVEAKGVCVARREDNHFINGTKLLNVAGMTRGRRDGILKSEKTRNVVKIGPMHLKGVWIPFERALEFANREKITELLYPLFVHNIRALLYHPTNSQRTNMVMEAANRRKQAQGAIVGPPGSQASNLHHHHSMNSQISSQISQPIHAIAPIPTAGRPALDRAHTFPTPPTSASSLMNSGGSYEWNTPTMNNSIPSSQPLAIDTGLSNARSMPSTPATTPPANSLHGMQSFQNPQSYDSSRSMYAASSQPTAQYASQPSIAQQNLARYTQSGAYMKNEMAPPSRSSTAGDSEHAEIKQDPYSHAQPTEQIGTAPGDEEAEHDHDTDYGQDGNAVYSNTRGSYAYNGGTSILHADHAHLSPEQVSSSLHQNGSGRTTPRTSSMSQAQWTGYNTPPRTDTYPSSNYHAAVAAMPASNKRARGDDDQEYRAGGDMEALKRRKSAREDNVGHESTFDRPISRARGTVVQRGHR